MLRKKLLVLSFLPDGMTTLAPSVGSVKLFSAEPFQKEALDHRLQKNRHFDDTPRPHQKKLNA